MNNSDINGEYWIKVVTLLQEARSTIPNGCEPEPKHYYDNPEEEWKNQAEKEALESEFYVSTDQYIRKYFTDHKWPARYKMAVPYYAGRRLLWARNFLRVLLTPINDELVIPAANIPPADFLCWLLTDAYNNRNPPPKRDEY